MLCARSLGLLDSQLTESNFVENKSQKAFNGLQNTPSLIINVSQHFWSFAVIDLAGLYLVSN